jgi:hypothetical protein
MTTSAPMPQGVPVIPGLPLTSWPTDPAARRALTVAAQALGQFAPLAVWAHGQATADGQRGPTLAAWAAMLGVSRPTLVVWRRRDPALGARAVAARGDARRWRRGD